MKHWLRHRRAERVALVVKVGDGHWRMYTFDPSGPSGHFDYFADSHGCTSLRALAADVAADWRYDQRARVLLELWQTWESWSRGLEAMALTMLWNRLVGEGRHDVAQAVEAAYREGGLEAALRAASLAGGHEGDRLPGAPDVSVRQPPSDKPSEKGCAPGVTTLPAPCHVGVEETQ